MASLLLWVLTHQADCKAWVQQGRAKGYSILGLWKYPEPRKKKLLLMSPEPQKHLESHLPSQILTLLFLQQFEAIDDKAQVDSQALSLEPRAQHDKHFLWEKRGRSLEPGAVSCARRTPVTVLFGEKKTP